MHLWEVKKESRTDKVIPIKFKEQKVSEILFKFINFTLFIYLNKFELIFKVCELEFEVICLYGRLGYGYSHQMPSLSDRSTFQNVEESNFFRLPGIDVSGEFKP